MKFRLFFVVLAVTCVGQAFGYSWRITNGTDRDLYIHLGTKLSVTDPIGSSKEGVLLKKGDSTGSSEILGHKFNVLDIADNKYFTKNKQTIKLADDHNINYTILSDGKGYDLQDNN